MDQHFETASTAGWRDIVALQPNAVRDNSGKWAATSQTPSGQSETPGELKRVERHDLDQILKAKLYIPDSH